MSCFVATCGSVEMHEDKRLANFKDNFGNLAHKKIKIPSIYHFLYESFPNTDEHNRMRQKNELEIKWLVKDFLFRFLATSTRLSVADAC